MPLFKKFVGEFDELDLQTAFENWSLLVGYKKDTRKVPLSELKQLFDSITELIPSAATSVNQLADKEYVDTHLSEDTARYLTADAAGSSFSSKAQLSDGPYYYGGNVTEPAVNDYALVNGDESHNNAISRYYFINNAWAFQYIVNQISLTPAQIAALNSLITAEKVEAYDSHIADSSIHVTPGDKQTWNDYGALAEGAIQSEDKISDDDINNLH